MAGPGAKLEIIEGGAPDVAVPAFYFDLASPGSYLVAERILQTLPVATEWIPVVARELPGHDAHAAVSREELAATLDARGLQPLRMPDPFPFDSDLAMRAATYAKQIGRTVPFALAAFRQCFAAGRGLDVEDHVLIAGSACEMHPTALRRSVDLRAVRAALTAAIALAVARGVRDVPAIWVPGVGDAPPQVFHGDAALDDAAAALAVVA
jgi:2-hydroxychromene-2-carboxylate isomerase